MSTASSPLPATSQTYVNQNFEARLLRGLSALQQNDHLTDVTLKSEGASLVCHRVVLAASSPYFQAMFTGGLQETTSPICEISEIDSAALQSIIQYIYSGQVNITTENVQNLAIAADMLDFPDVRAACEEFFSAQDISPTNCLGYYKFAKVLQMKQLETKTRAVVMQNFSAVVQADEFKDISDTELIEFISDSNLQVANEDVVFEAVKKWMNCDFPSRSVMFEQVLAHVRLPYCSSAYLLNLIGHETMNQPHFQTDMVRKFLQEAQKFHLSPDHQHTICSPRTIPRKSYGDNRRLIVLGGLKESGVNNDCWFFNDTLEVGDSPWATLTRLPRKGLRLYSTCVVQQSILLTGGYHNDHLSSSCWMFDVAARKWRKIVTLPTARSNHASVAHCGRAYLLGGQGSEPGVLSSVECIDLDSQTVTKKKPMQIALCDPLATSFGSNIFVFGGHEDEFMTPSTSTQKYDTVWQEWTLMARMPKPCDQGAAVVVNDRVFLVGGFAMMTFMSYTPASDSWTLLTAPNAVRANAPAVVWQGKILIAGGEAKDLEPLSSIEEYDVDENKWSDFELPLEKKLFFHHMLNINIPEELLPVDIM